MFWPLSRLFLWQYLATLKGQKCEIDSCELSDLQKSLARGAATDCRPFIPTVLFWSFQVLWQLHQRCGWGRRPAGSLAELSPGKVILWGLLSNSVHCVAEAARCQLDQFERSKLLHVPRLANLVAMFSQFVRRRVLLGMFWAIDTVVSSTTLGNIERSKMWNRQLQMVGLAKVTCKRSGNRLPSFYSQSPLLIIPGALATSPKVPMGPQTCWKSCGTLPWRSCNLLVAIKFLPLRGRSCAVPAGPIWEKQTSICSSSRKLGCDV